MNHPSEWKSKREGALQLLLTPAAWRVVDAAVAPEDPSGHRSSDATLTAQRLQRALWEESECVASTWMRDHHIGQVGTLETVPSQGGSEAGGREHLVAASCCVEDGSGNDIVVAFDLASALRSVTAWFRRMGGDSPLATEHLLLAVAEVDGGPARRLIEAGLDEAELRRRITARYGLAESLESTAEEPLPIDAADMAPRKAESSAPRSTIPMSEPIEPQPDSPSDAPRSPSAPEDDRDDRPVAAPTVPLLRLVDAAANRACEALRVAEDYTRFVLDDRHLTRMLKSLRHDVAAALEVIPIRWRLTARETLQDVGTALSTSRERWRGSAEDCAAASFGRLAESLRSLEEYTKVVSPEAGEKLKQARYRAYTLHRAVGLTQAGNERLRHACLYVLVDGRPTPEAFTALVGALVRAEVDLLQLRDKRLSDRELLGRARTLRELTSGSATAFVMNDRPDLALLAQADGVHIGQEELSVKEVRSVVGPSPMVGVSTHSIQQARQAVLDGADYIGVGPTFPSKTKAFDAYAGLDLVREVARDIRLPAFAIGGIDHDNVHHVLEAGLARVAVAGAVVEADDPVAAVQSLRGVLAREGSRQHDGRDGE